MLFKASAPGSLMLLGEYAVLHGQHALVCAIDKRITVTLTPRQDTVIKIQSALGQLNTSLSTFSPAPPFQFVLAALQAVRKKLIHGCDILIESEFSATVGFASSAAVTVAVLAALSAWLELQLSQIALIKLARKVIRSVQGMGSGADVAACVLGGSVLYRQAPFLAEKINAIPQITVVYSGYKTPTPIAIQTVKKRFDFFPDIFRALCKSINECTLNGAEALAQQNWPRLGNIMNIQQGLMDVLGVNTPLINAIIEKMKQEPTLLGAKISGSGLGDCIVGLGTVHLPHIASIEPAVKQMRVGITREGVRCEKI